MYMCMYLHTYTMKKSEKVQVKERGREQLSGRGPALHIAPRRGDTDKEKGKEPAKFSNFMPKHCLPTAHIFALCKYYA